MKMEEKIIEFVKNNVMLYDKSCRSYKYVNEKEKKWKELAAELKTTDAVAKKRWKTLRDKFFREHKKENQPSGSAGVLRPTWKYYESMMFLRDVSQSRETTSNYVKDSTVEENSCNAEINFEDLIEEYSVDSIIEETSEDCSNFEPAEKQSQNSYRRTKRRKLQENLLIKNKCKEMSSLIAVARENFSAQTPTKIFFQSLALQVEDAKLPFEKLSALQLKLMHFVHEEIKKYSEEQPGQQ